MRKEVIFRSICVWIGVIILLGTFSCQSEYEKMVKRELESGVRSDSLFFGLYLGMSNKDFFARCWELNNQGVFFHGAQNTTVEYRFDDFGKAATMNFYPEFKEGKIYEMPVTIAYNAFAPWDKSYSADTLLNQTMDFITPWFGDEFIELSHPEKGEVLAKVHGNKRILVYKSGNQVKLLITDLSIKEKAGKQKNRNT